MAIFEHPESILTFMDFLRYTNSQVDGLLGVAMLIVIGMVSFLTTKNYTYERALGFAGFMVMLSAIFLRFMNLIGDSVLFGCIVIFVFSVVLLFKERGFEEQV